MAQRVQVLLVCDLHGDETPAAQTVEFALDGTARPYCGGGYQSHREYVPHQPHYRPGPSYGYQPYKRELSEHEIRYYCSLGSQTPISVREDCVRYGYW